MSTSLLTVEYDQTLRQGVPVNLTMSYALTSSFLIGTTLSSSYSLSSSYAPSIFQTSGSWASASVSSSYSTLGQFSISSSWASSSTSASYSSITNSSSYAINATSASYSLTASYAANSSAGSPASASWASSSLTSSITTNNVPITWSTLVFSNPITWSAVPNVYEDRQILVLTGSTTMSISNLYNGWSGVLQVSQSGSTYGIKLPTNTKVAYSGSGGILLTSGISGSVIDFVGFTYIGTTLYANVANNWT